MSNGTVATKISVTDGMSPALKQMFGGVNSLIMGLRNLGDEKSNAFDTKELEEAAMVMNKMIVGAKGYEQQLFKTNSAVELIENSMFRWQSIGGIETFNTSGIERAEQEISAANEAYDRLSQRQEQISSEVRAMKLMPENAVSDISFVDNKVSALRSKMSLLDIQQSKIGKFNTSGAEMFNSKTEDIRRKMARIEALQQRINTAVAENDIDGVNAGYRELNAIVDNIDNKIKSNTTAQMSFNNALNTGEARAKSLAGSLGRAATLFMAGFSGKKAVESVDTYTNTTARLALLTDNDAELRSLQNSIFQNAKGNRSIYNDSVSNVAKLGLLAGDAFRSNSEIVMFDSLMSKVFKISGASTEERTSGMYQLTQAMAAGKLQGDEFRSIMENAPLLAQAIADYTGKSKGELKEMSAEGTITADIIKGALFEMADDVNEKFDSIPLSFADTTNAILSDIQYKSANIKQRINDMLNGDIGTSIVSDIGSGVDWAINRGNELISWFERTAIIAGPTINGIKQDFVSLANAIAGPNGEVKVFLTSMQRLASSDGTRKTLQQLGGAAVTVAKGFNMGVSCVTKLNQKFSGLLPTMTGLLIAYKSFQLINGTLNTPINNMLGLIDSSVQRYNSLSAAINRTTQATTLMNSALTATRWLTYAGGIATVVSGLASVALGIMSVKNAQDLADESAEDNPMINGHTPEQISRAREAGVSVENYIRMEQEREKYKASIEAVKAQYEKDLEDNDYMGILTKGPVEGIEELDDDQIKSIYGVQYFNAVKFMPLYKAERDASYNQELADLKSDFSETMAQIREDDKNAKNEKDEEYNAYDDSYIQKVEVVDTVDIASEDLRYLREMAEQEAINQFTSKLLQPQINITFGEVRETADVDAIVKKITNDMIDELNSGADFIHY